MKVFDFKTQHINLRSVTWCLLLSFFNIKLTKLPKPLLTCKQFATPQIKTLYIFRRHLQISKYSPCVCCWSPLSLAATQTQLSALENSVWQLEADLTEALRLQDPNWCVLCMSHGATADVSMCNKWSRPHTAQLNGQSAARNETVVGLYTAEH